MVEISDSDTLRILDCLDIAIAYYKQRPALKDINRGRIATLLKNKLNRKLSKQHLKSQNHDKE